MSKTKKDFISCTTILYILTITGAGINYMLRVNISIAIVDMIKPINNTNLTINNKFDWSSMEKNELLAVYLWGYVMAVAIGGRLSEKYGAKIVIGGGMVAASVLTLFFPVMCRVHFYFALVGRLLLGGVLGTFLASIMPLGVKWIPPLDRSKFSSNVSATGVGVAFTLPLCGFLIHYLGWESVFYVTGAIGLLWCLLWFIFVFDSPGEHPRISEVEKNYIESKLRDEQKVSSKQKVPWAKVFTSIPVWAIFFAQMGSGFYHFTYTMQLPTYMNDVLHFNIANNGLLSALPFVGYYIFSVIGSIVADEMMKSGKVKIFTVRRIMTVIAYFIPSAVMLILAFFRMHYILAVFLLICLHLFRGAIVSSNISNVVDIAPNYSGTIYGSSLVFASASGWFGNKLVGFLTKEKSDFSSWSTVFIIIALVSAAGGLVFFIFGSGEIQKWNHEKNVMDEKEVEPLNVEAK